MKGKQFTDLAQASALKDSDIIAVHDGNGLKQSNMEDVTAYMSNKFSNPNLLINPDFKINQRGAASYTSNGYTVDRWKINSGTVNVSSSGITVTLNNKGQFIQLFENTLSGTYTATIKVTSITGDCGLFIGSHSIQLNKAGTFTITEKGSIDSISLYKYTAGTCTINVEYIKLEQGTVATPFVAPNPSEELVKCNRYYYRSKAYKYGVVPEGKAWVVEVLRQDFRTEPTLQISTTYESHINKKEQRVTSIGNIYVISLKLISTDNVLDAYALETEIKVDAEIY